MDETPSRTSDIPAVMRALHQSNDDAPKILLDPIAPRLVDVANLDLAWLDPILRHPFAPQWRAGFLIRNRYAEDCLAEALARGVQQYLILGAGFDTFAYRQPAWASALEIFEIDHPATQALKRGALAKAGIRPPANLSFVPIDFESTRLDQALGRTRFALASQTFCSLLGVTQYLTIEAITSTLAFVLSLPAGSEIVLSFILPQSEVPGVEADAVATAAAKAAEAGEPWVSRFRPEDIAAFLHRLGFSTVAVLTPGQVQARYLSRRGDGLAARTGEQLLRAVV